MNEDILKKWKPYSQNELLEVIGSYTKQWWLAGGHAIDRFLGKTTRIHEDIDIVVPRNDQVELWKFLDDWELYIAAGDLTLWENDEFLDLPVYDVWAMKNKWFRFQIMFIDTIDEQWVFKRDKAVSEDLSSFGTFIDGMPVIKPEIQLLHKFYMTKPRPKDYQDWENTYPQLNDQAKAWLDQYVIR